MKRILLAMLLVAGCSFSTLTPVSAQEEKSSGVPEPELVTSSWMLTFTYDTPRTIAIEMPDGSTQWYWYMTYQVLNDPRIRNNNRESILFIPDIIIADDRGGIQHANRNISPRVFPAIKRLLRNDLLESPAQVPGNMLPGEDYIKESVAIWPVSEDDVDEFTVFIAGIYGETCTIPHPVTGEPMTEPVTNPRTGEPVLNADGEPETRPIYLRRNRMLRFSTPGTIRNPQRQSIRLEEETDVMR
ncbi:MAG: hypothetical protein ACIAXF_11370 [Phycisphaerales bacterium JB063]